MSIRESISYFPTSDATRFTSIILVHSLFHLISGNDVSGEQSRGATDTGGSHRGGRSLLPKKEEKNILSIYCFLSRLLLLAVDSRRAGGREGAAEHPHLAGEVHGLPALRRVETKPRGQKQSSAEAPQPAVYSNEIGASSSVDYLKW